MRPELPAARARVRRPLAMKTGMRQIYALVCTVSNIVGFSCWPRVDWRLRPTQRGSFSGRPGLISLRQRQHFLRLIRVSIDISLAPKHTGWTFPDATAFWRGPPVFSSVSCAADAGVPACAPSPMAHAETEACDVLAELSRLRPATVPTCSTRATGRRAHSSQKKPAPLWRSPSSTPVAGRGVHLRSHGSPRSLHRCRAWRPPTRSCCTCMVD